MARVRENRYITTRLVLLWVLLELLAATQVRTEGGPPVAWTWVRSLAAPVVGTTRHLAGLADDLLVGLSDTQHLVAEHRRLRTEVEELRARNLLLEEDRTALAEAVSVLGGVAGYADSAVLGRCSYRNLALGQMEVNVPANAVIRPDTPAISGGGLVGRVVRCAGSSCWLQLITHPAAAVAVQNRSGTLQGLATGSGRLTLDVEYLPHSATILVGDVLLTSGADGVYPPGLPVAAVTRIRETDASFLEVAAAPQVDLAQVRVVLLLPKWSRRLVGGGSP
jgi:rod shape-determining protein MreC